MRETFKENFSCLKMIDDITVGFRKKMARHISLKWSGEEDDSHAVYSGFSHNQHLLSWKMNHLRNNCTTDKWRWMCVSGFYIQNLYCELIAQTQSWGKIR